MSMSISSHKYDVIVVGMGPAGASAAFELSQRGLSVLAFDKQAPRILSD
jgi:flavin-dependent dehydrogenase